MKMSGAGTADEKNFKRKWTRNFYGGRADNDACLEEKEMLGLCHTINGSGSPICADYKLNWSKCAEFWNDIKRERRKAGIKPELPPLSERETIMAAKFGP